MAAKKDVAQILTILRAAIPRQKITRAQFREMITTWTAVLSDLPAEELQLAVYQWISSDKPWFPTPGQIRQRAFDLTRPAVHAMTPAEAWGEVKRALVMGQHRFASGQEAWSSPFVRRAFEAIGGWPYFRRALISSEMSDRARFMEAFERLQEADIEQHRALPQVREYRRLMAGKQAALPQSQGESVSGAQVEPKPHPSRLLASRTDSYPDKEAPPEPLEIATPKDP